VILLSEKTRIKKIYSAFFREEFPADLTLVVVWLAIGIVASYLPFLNQTPVPFIFTLPVVLIIPGYCLIAALFPKKDDIGLVERVMLSIGFSLAITTLIGFGLNFTPWGIQLDYIVISLTLLTWVMILVAHYRRSLLPLEERFAMPFSKIASTIREGFFPDGSSTVNRLLSAILVIVILIAITTTTYVIIAPKESEHFTEFFIFGENKTAAEYPDLIITGQNYPMFIGVGNHEYRDITYTIETWLIRTEFDNVSNTSHIIAMESNDHLSFTLTDNKTTIIPYNLSVKKTGYDRVEFLLFNESVPGLDMTGSERINASYRDLNLRVTVKDAEY